jgi:Sec-independent protein secretion pathway component TatC
MAIPLMILYEISIVVARRVEKTARKDKEAAAEGEES